MTDILDPITNVVEYRGFIRYYNSSFLDIIIDSSQFMDEIHKVKLLGLKYNYENKRTYDSDRRYMNASDYASLTTIFRRYKQKLLDESLPVLKEKLIVAYAEMELFAKRHQELVTEMQKSANTGTLQTVDRPADKTRYKKPNSYSGGKW